MVSGVNSEVHMTHVLHTVGISNFDSVMFVNRIREMVSFEFSKEIEIEKDVFFRDLIVNFPFKLLHISLLK